MMMFPLVLGGLVAPLLGRIPAKNYVGDGCFGLLL